ncbi:MAG: hypothetical protein ABIT83_23880 [Massilia sp.]
MKTTVYKAGGVVAQAFDDQLSVSVRARTRNSRVVGSLERQAIEPNSSAAGLDILITCTYRSGAEEDVLYAQGCTKPGARGTNARAG